jgi:hypothetical protein
MVSEWTIKELFHFGYTDCKEPCILKLQVWGVRVTLYLFSQPPLKFEIWMCTDHIVCTCCVNVACWND